MWGFITLIGAVAVALGGIMQAIQSGDQADRIEQLQKENEGNETGGDSYPEFHLSQQVETPPLTKNQITYAFYFSLKTKGKYSLRNVKIRVVDIQDFRTKSSASFYSYLSGLDLNFPSPFHKVKNTIISHFVVYEKDFDKLNPLPPVIIDPRSDRVFTKGADLKILNTAIPLNKDFPYQGFDIYIESEYKYWSYQIRFVTKNENTEYAIRQYEINGNNEWKEIISEKKNSEGYDYLDKDKNPIFYGIK